jgi:outer membrane immunogenic protein
MRQFVIAALVALALGAQAANAADLISYPTSAAGDVPVAGSAPFNWNGFYAGVSAVYQHGAALGDQYGLGVDAGVSTTFNFVLAGAEVSVAGLGNGSGSTGYAEILGRGGLLLTDNALLYGAVGYGLDTGPTGGGELLAGGGVELGLTDNVSLRAQYLHGFPAFGGTASDQVTLGAQFHF